MSSPDGFSRGATATSPTRACMATICLSMFIPNMLTVLALLPIVEALAKRLEEVRAEAQVLVTPLILSLIYGANIGAVRRHVYEEKTGEASLLVTGYTNTQLPNFWDRSQDIRAAAG